MRRNVKSSLQMFLSFFKDDLIKQCNGRSKWEEMSEIIHKRQDGEGGFAFGDEDSFLRGITLSFSWDYPDDYSLKDVQDTVFFVYDDKNKPRYNKIL